MSTVRIKEVAKLARVSTATVSHVINKTRLSVTRSEEHTSELQSQSNLVCRLLLEKKSIFASRNVRDLTPPRSTILQAWGGRFVPPVVKGTSSDSWGPTPVYPTIGTAQRCNPPSL